jgi:hypothetical protein
MVLRFVMNTLATSLTLLVYSARASAVGDFNNVTLLFVNAALILCALVRLVKELGWWVKSSFSFDTVLSKLRLPDFLISIIFK